MREATIRKYRAIQNTYRELYDNHKMRSKEAVKIIMEQYYFGTENAVYRILNLDLPVVEVYKDPDQLELPFPPEEDNT